MRSIGAFGGRAPGGVFVTGAGAGAAAAADASPSEWSATQLEMNERFMAILAGTASPLTAETRAARSFNWPLGMGEPAAMTSASSSSPAASSAAGIAFFLAALTQNRQSFWAHLAAEIERLLEAAAAALDTMDPSDLGAVLGEADALRLREPPIEKVRETLGLPAERFLSEQLKAAKRHGDIPREDALNTAIKDLIFERSGDAFDLAKLPRLRTADEFANAKMGGKKERREGFLRHQSKPIPTSLTQLDSKEKREEAVAVFKSILGYMGDAPYQFPIMLAVELVTKALSGGAELQVTGCHCHHRHRLLLHCHHLHLTSSTIPSADRGVRPADETAEP